MTKAARRARRALLGALALTLAVAASAAAATTSTDTNGAFRLNGSRFFPIVLSDGPPRGGTTPSGAGALAEVASGGANFLRIGPTGTGAVWNDTEIADAQAWDAALAPLGMYSWIKLRDLASAQPGTANAALLQKVLTSLKGDAGFGLWKGADEPWWGGLTPAQLQYAYCMGTSRGSLSWCSPDSPVDADHVWVTIEAPKGTASDLQPYSAVTDSHGVDIYPVTYGVTNPDLHQVGTWTQTLSSITPNHAVWTTLQVCSSGSRATDGSGNFVQPTRLQERYMIYDAIINGARALAFFGGNVTYCYTGTDATYGWNWTYWNSVLKGLLQEIDSTSPIAPALVSDPSPQTLASSDGTTELLARQGAGGASDIWLMAARSGAGTQTVTISGLPSSVSTGTVYAEGRSVSVANGAFSDTFGQWDVHVYHFVAPAAPTVTGFSPTSGPPGTSVTVSGTSLTGATSVTFNGAPAAAYTVDSATQITATVPSGATSGPIAVTTPGGRATSAASFAVTAVPAPTITSFSPGSGRAGTVVTIVGTNLGGVTAVRFNGVPATSYTANSPTQVTATVPNGARNGPISVTTPGGTATSSKAFKVK